MKILCFYSLFYSLVFVSCLSVIGCSSSLEPAKPESYQLKLTVIGGAPNVTVNYADTIIYTINKDIYKLAHVRLPWIYNSSTAAGDSISLKVFDPRADCCPVPATGDGYAVFAKIEIYSGTSLGMCTSYETNVPSLDGTWMHTSLLVDDNIIKKNLDSPSFIKNRCEPEY